MKSKLIKAIGAVGGYHLARNLTANQPKLLMYHRFSSCEVKHQVSSAVFEQQLKQIQRYFHPMSVADLAKSKREKKVTPKNVVAITVDDGYKDFYEIAYPLLKHYKIPATFYVTTGFVSGKLWLWPDQVTWLLENKLKNVESVNLAGKVFNLSLPSSALWWPIVELLLAVENQTRVTALKQLELAVGVVLPVQAPEKYTAVNWAQLMEMQSNGIEVGGHTVTHPSLGRMSATESEWEIRESFKALAENLGDQQRSFCYPNGTHSDYSNTVKNQTESAGYVAAVTAFSDKYNLDIPFAWRRFVGSEQVFRFNKSLFGVEHLGNKVRNTTRCNY